MKFSAGWIVAVTCFATGAFGGFLLTGMPSLTEGNWLLLVGGRVLWQLGGAIWLGLATAALFEATRWKFALPFAVVGVLLCFNPLLDLVRGPEILEGKLTRVEYLEGSVWTTRAPTKTIDAIIEVETRDGERTRFQPSGRHANQWSETLRQCQSRRSDVRIVLLRRLDAAIQVECLPPAPASN